MSSRGLGTRSSYKKYKHEKLDFSRFILDPVDKPALLHGSKNKYNVIPAKAGIQHKARQSELLALEACCVYAFFWIPAYAGMTYKAFFEPCNNTDQVAG
ncbi:MAG: palindromic element RPE4 domain-containing protein [Rickettsia endosymbiont of Graphium doson]|nr:palindromic element RPE4 domain-containing protein [Rickettsia endosymbiont of Graphium doson]